MKLDKADMQCKQVATPPDYRCSSGHKAPATFRLGGAGTPEAPIRFFEIYKDNKSLGVFCEPCLIIANYVARQKKKENK